MSLDDIKVLEETFINSPGGSTSNSPRKSASSIKSPTKIQDEELAKRYAELPTYNDVLDAVENLKGTIHRTQVLTSKTINEMLGARLNNG